MPSILYSQIRDTMKLIKDPLVHFLAIGAAFFALYSFVSPPNNIDKNIVISSGRIDALEQQFQKTWNRQPNPEELKNLIDGFSLEEIYYRQAKQLGLDNNDAIIRRRLQQKMEFFSQSMLEDLQPSDEILNAFIADNADDYRSDNHYSFEQVFISSDRSSEELAGKMADLTSALNSGESAQGDTSLLPANFQQVSAFQVDRQLGKDFSLQLDQLELNRWSQPLKSGLGLHLIKLNQFEQGQLPALADVRDKVERNWRYQQQQSTKQVLDKQLLQAYRIDIQWPPTADQKQNTDQLAQQ